MTGTKKHLTKVGLWIYIYIYIVYDIKPLDDLVRVELHSLVLDVGISPLIPLVSVKFHSWVNIYGLGWDSTSTSSTR